MTSRPGRIKQVVDIPLADRTSAQDIRTATEFTALRHQVWSLLQDEVQKAELLERQMSRRRVSDLLSPDEKEVIGVG
jgi:NitT/TauT family transport system ATP-binding protein